MFTSKYCGQPTQWLRSDCPRCSVELMRPFFMFCSICGLLSILLNVTLDNVTTWNSVPRCVEWLYFWVVPVVNINNRLTWNQLGFVPRVINYHGIIFFIPTSISFNVIRFGRSVTRRSVLNPNKLTKLQPLRVFFVVLFVTLCLICSIFYFNRINQSLFLEPRWFSGSRPW